MKKVIYISILAVLFSFVPIKDKQTVKWKLTLKKNDANTYTLIAKAKIIDGFILYGTNLKEGGPLSTSIHFETLKNCKTVNGFTELNPPEKLYDPIFDMDIPFYRNSATFYQTIECKIKGNTIKGYIQWMSCNGVLCTAPKKEHFEFYIE